MSKTVKKLNWKTLKDDSLLSKDEMGNQQPSSIREVEKVQRLVKVKTQIRSDRTYYKDIPEDVKQKIISEYQSNEKITAKELSERYSVTQKLVKKVLKKAGIEIRFVSNFIHVDREKQAEAARRNFSKKIAIEVDDKHHFECSKETKLSHARRQKRLESFGWNFLRFRNEEVREGIQTCLDKIFNHIGLRVEITTSALPQISHKILNLSG